MRSIAAIAARAQGLFPVKAGGPTLLGYQVAVEEGFRRLVTQAGGLYRGEEEIPLTLSTRWFDLPDDFRELDEGGAVLWYAPRAIASISRAANVVTVNTTLAHGLAAGMKVKIAGVTGTGGTDFNEDSATVATAPLTTRITYAQTDSADTGTGGTVEQPLAAVALAYSRISDLDTLQPPAAATPTSPRKLFFRDALQFGVEPMSAGSYPALTLSYDAQMPEAPDLDAALPGPADLEEGLMRYAAGMCGALPEKDGRAALEQAVLDWRRLRSLREARNLAEGRW